MEDAENDEKINEDPEGWVLSKLSSMDVRVVVIASKPIASYLRTGSPSPNTSSSCTTSSTEVHPDSPTGNFLKIVLAFNNYVGVNRTIF